uniref:UDP-xylose synthase n=1 Tax=Ganoderma boninense TaxID=34458 RepID=A0A5K1K420_9APHY|nr:UDP-xylose synthase [Ganoderma boninense]
MLCRLCIPKVPAPTRTRALATSATRLIHIQALRHSSLLTHSRPSSHTIPQSQHARFSSQIRDAFRTRASFSTTAQRRANEVPTENLQAMFSQQQKLLKLMQEKPELLENINEFMQLLKDNGVDLSTGVMPSKMFMLRLLMKQEIRESAMKMVATLQEAGIDIQSKEVVESFMAMQKMAKDVKK